MLGVSYFYLLLIVVVLFGFMYGYDGIDLVCINLELGGEEVFW